MSPKIAVPILMVILLASTYVYLYPGSQALLEGRTDTVLSDGTDIASLPYINDLLGQIWKNHPERFFYGSIYSDGGDPERGIGYWIPWNERWLVLLHSLWAPAEQLSTAFTASLIFFNAIAFFLLCRYLGWPIWISAALSFSWAFNPYARARAKVHPALVGTYHLPLIFLGLYLVVQGRTWRSVLAAAVAFFIASTVAHYYLLTILFVSPLFLIFVILQPSLRRNAGKSFSRLVIAILPTLIFLASNFYFALPEGARVTAEQSMNFREFANDQVDPFLGVFYAHPIDFLAGDIALAPTTIDWNPLRAWIGDGILADLGLSNSHERSNGIRWIVLALSCAGIVGMVKRRKRPNAYVDRNIIFFSVFALFTFWLASGPSFPTSTFNPSYWLYSLCSKIRVASRAGTMVHFSLLMITGFYLTTKFKLRKYLVMPGVLLALVFVDYPPLQSMPMAPLQPPYQALQRTHGPCGPGLALPYFSPFLAMGALYVFSQRLRGSDCTSLNQFTDIRRVDFLTKLFPPSQEFVARLDHAPEVIQNIQRLAHCVPLNWIVFHEIVPRPVAESVCQRLGWVFGDDMTCVAPEKGRPLERYPDQCFQNSTF